MDNRPVNPAHIVSLYKNLPNPNGGALIASSTTLINFGFSEVAAQTTPDWRVYDLNTGYTFVPDDSLIIKRHHDGTSYYFFNGQNIGTTLPCGDYRIQVTTNMGNYYSDRLEVKDICMNDRASMTLTGFNGTNAQIQGSDSGTIEDRWVMVEIDGQWVNVTTLEAPLGGTVNNFFVDASAPPVKLRRYVRTTCNELISNYTLHSYDNGGLTAGYLSPLEPNNSYGIDNLWKLEFGNDNDANGVPYSQAFTQCLYADVTFEFPEIEGAEPNEFDNGNGESYVQSNFPRETITATIPDIPEYSVAPLHNLHTKKIKRLINVNTGVVHDLTDYDISFAEVGDKRTATVTITFTRNQFSNRACEENIGFAA